ncbi:unnamed protein product [Effrenium voratum]|nr:unnamed protein product [Effrenium voratum]
MSFMGGKTKEGKYIPGGAGFVTFDPVTLEMKRRWEVGKQIDFNYDFWYQPRRNVMVSSEWGDPECFTNGFNPAHVADGRYGRKLYVWNWTERTLIKELDLGVGAIPLEVRFLHNPDKAEGYVGNALSSEMVRFVEREGDWVSEIAIKVEPIEVEGWALPAMPSLITDFCISLDDKYLYFSNWLHGDVRQYDISVVKGVEIQGGSGAFFGIWTHGAMGVKINHAAQMVQLSLDGKRLYVSTSLFSSWDRQFYPDMLKRGAQLLQLDVDTEKGGLTVNPEFLVDFGQDGPVSCHEMRFPGGDSTSATEEMQFLLPHSRREAVTELPIPVEKFRSVVEMDRMAENSVFLATKPRGRDTRLKLDTLKRSESRLTGRRRAVQADASGPNDQRGEGIDRPQENKLGFYLRSPEETSEATNIFTQCDADGDGSMNLDEFQTFVQKVRAKLLTLRRREEVLIAKKFDLEPELMHEFRASLPFLWKVFERYSFNKPEQGVRREDLLPFMVDAGVAPPNTEDPQSLPLMDIIKEFARPLSKFPAVLEIVQKGRLALRASLEEDLTASFRYYDRDGSGQLSKQEIYGILEEFGMLPRTKAEQQEVGQVVEQLDRDGSGSFDLLEFHDFFQMMMEQVRLAERKREGELALSLGFSEERCAYLRRTALRRFGRRQAAGGSREESGGRRPREDGKCARGSRCTFAHGLEQLRPRPDLYKTRLCSSYALCQSCPYGDSCTHAHGPEELRAVAEPREVAALKTFDQRSASTSGDEELALPALVHHFGVPQTPAKDGERYFAQMGPSPWKLLPNSLSAEVQGSQLQILRDSKIQFTHLPKAPGSKYLTV